MSQYDVVIIGGGAAGLTAGLFAARYGLKTLLLERMIPGGQVINAEQIENFPGFPQGLAGFDLGPLMQEQATNAGVELKLSEATALRVDDPYRVVHTSEGPVVAKAVIIAGGSTLRKLGLPKEEELHGSGVSYCATCDGAFFTGEVVGVVGGGDSALDEALVLTQFASRVVIFHRRDAFRAQKVLQDRVRNNSTIQVRWNTQVTEILGERQVEGVAVKDTVTGETSRVDLTGLFIYIGLDPNTDYLREVLPLDNAGHIATDLWMETEVPGVFAAGDLRQRSAAQLITAAGDGATAAIAAHRYITSRTWP